MSKVVGSHAGFALAVALVLFGTATAADQPESFLSQTGSIDIKDVHGKLGPFAADIYQGRMFLAATENNTVEVLDLRTRDVIGSLQGVTEPLSIAYLKSSNRIFVVSGADGTLHMFSGSTLKPLGSLRLGAEAEQVQADPAHQCLYASYGEGALVVLDANGKRSAEIPLKSHPASFQIAQNTPRIFVNLPGEHALAVIDSKTLQPIAEWPLKEGRDNTAIALDEDKRRAFVACRLPARLLVLDMDTGRIVASLPTAADPGSVTYDPIHARVYVIGALGQIAVYAQESADRYVKADAVSTVAGARTGLFVPEWNLLFVAVRDLAGHAAEVRLYQPR